MQERVWHKHYDAGVPRELPYEELSLPQILERTAERYPQAAALRFLNLRMSYAQLKHEVDRMATGLAELGVGPGTGVAIHMPNVPQFVIGYYAALSLGARIAMTNPLYTPREIEHQWQDAECTVALTMDFLYDQVLAPSREKLPITDYVVASIPEYLGLPLRWLAGLKLRREDPPKAVSLAEDPSVHPFRKLVRASETSPPRPELDPEAVAILQYTGGTTGPSKGAMLTHRNISCNVQQTHAWFSGVRMGREVMLTALPLFHVFGMTVAMNWPVYAGATMVLIPNPRDVGAVVKAVSKHRVTQWPGVPAMFNSLNNYPGIESIDVTSVQACFSGSAPIPVDVLERFEKLTGARILEGFGMSESSPVSHVNPLGGMRKIGTVGLPVSDTDARIVDTEDGTRELPIGEEGELIIQGPQVMKGYWKRPDETANTLRDGWLYTGDLATIDEDGFFRIVGRKKDMINCGGFKVFPDEVDAVLMAHEDILEAATIGVPDERRGETVKSFVVLQPGKQLTAADVEAWCRESLAAYKVPREVEFLDELPKSPVLKVLRRELRKRELARRGLAGAKA